MDALCTASQIFEELSVNNLGGAYLSHFRASRTGHLGESSLKIEGTGSDEASKIPDSLRIREDINEFASCEECTKSSKNLKIVLFHYPQLDFRKCLKAPKTVQK